MARRSLRLCAALAAAAALLAPQGARAAFNDPLDIFVGGASYPTLPTPVSNFRIPALARTAKGTLVAIAEARTAEADCCYKYLVARRSTDNGASWSAPAVVWGANLTGGQGAGNPALVFDAITGKLVLHGSVNDPQHCSPTLYTFQLDDGGSDGANWGGYLPLKPFLGAYDGATPGPGTGTQLGPNSVAPGRLVIAAHYGVYQDDVSWYSDDHGASWTLSEPALAHLDEVVVSGTPDGGLVLNARTAHYNASCDCRAVSRSTDGGASWGPLAWDATLIEPVCQASLVMIGPLASSGNASALFFSNPASKTDRANITVRRSDDNANTWRPGTWLVEPGETWGGYSCIAPGLPIVQSGPKGAPVEYGAIIYETARPHGPPGTPGAATTAPVISFALFPVDTNATSPRVFIPASHPSVAWQGRRVVNPDGSVSFDMAGVTASLAVSGATYFEAQFATACAQGAPRLESAVDGAALNTDGAGSFWLDQSFFTGTRPYTVPLYSGLDGAANHTLQLRLATEARWSGCTGPSGVTLTGFYADGQPLPAPAPPSRRLDWVGDSITAGFGTAPKGGANPCPSTAEVEDPSRAAPLAVCATLGTDCAIEAVSGDTVLVPQPGGAPADKPPMPEVYTRALTYQPQLGWNFTSWAPDAVVCNLGTNDQAVPNFNASYVPALTVFLLQLSSAGGWYGGLPGVTPPVALAYCGPIVFDYCEPMQRAVEAANAAGGKAVFLGAVNATLDGCDGHPGPQGQAQMAAWLAPRIAAALHWA